MNTAASHTLATHTAEPDPVDVFALRCWACAYLVAIGDKDKITAIDDLQANAEFTGLVDQIGQDQVQAILAAQFGAAT